jgi:hypothetical protein
VSALPKRVIEINGDHVYLRELKDFAAKYVCLSHCWGKKGAALKLTSATHGTLRGGVARAQLPKTFREATDICTRLNIRFLWIDAICKYCSRSTSETIHAHTGKGILQDDNDDWTEAAATMADIYENAFVTIAATWSSDSNGGCFSQTREKFQVKKLGITGLYAQVSLPDIPQSGYSKYLDASGDDWPLLQRGWVMQERYLSPRVVHYAKDQLLWECNSTFRSDNDEVRFDIYREMFLASEKTLKHRNHHDSHESWRQLITNYTHLSFTKDTDLLPALAGIVRREMSHRKSDLYIAGMWRDSLLDDLAFHSFAGPRPESSAPTWSWASMAGKVFFGSYTRLSGLELTGLEFTRDGPSNVGQVTNASIRLKGPILVFSVMGSELVLTTPVQPSIKQVSLHWMDGRQNIASESSLTVMIISCSCRSDDCMAQSDCIVLSEVKGGVFKRVGAASIKVVFMHNDRDQAIDDVMNAYVASLPLQEVEII